jgi:hypothetical protein
VTSTGPKSTGGGSAGRRAVAAGGTPLEGTKAQGRLGPHSGACVGAATDFRGGQSPEGGRGFGASSASKPLEPTPGGLVRPEGADRAAEGETFEGRNPKSVIGLKQGRKGFGRKKASGGRETLETQRTRVRQSRERSLPDSASAVGNGTLERRVSPRGGSQARYGHTPKRSQSPRGARDTISRYRRGGGCRKAPGKPAKPVRVRGKRRTHKGATVIRGNP